VRSTASEAWTAPRKLGRMPLDMIVSQLRYKEDLSDNTKASHYKRNWKELKKYEEELGV
jgi:hypothetical protein